MENNDTILLLKECDSGSKMAVTSIDEILDKVIDCKLKQILSENKEQHEKLGNEIHALLLNHNASEKEPTTIAKGMSWLKTNVKLTMDNSDATIADLITDGCHMGIKSLHKYLNQYKNADKEATSLCNELIKIEEKLCNELQDYL